MSTVTTDIDVTAFNDVAVHGLTKPRDVKAIREELWARPAFHECADWNAVHREYAAKFDEYLHDADTLNWRDQRKRRIEQSSRRDAKGRRRA